MATGERQYMFIVYVCLCVYEGVNDGTEKGK